MSDQPTTQPPAGTPEQCLVIAGRLVELGRLLFVGGALVGPDRVDGRTRFGYGDDRVVGLAVAVEIAGDLATAAVNLLGAAHPYSAAALLRQLIEVEYLLWLFASDGEQSRRWLNADDEELRKIFSPFEIRKRSEGHFGHDEYRYHCGWGGHPSPHARQLLADHSEGEDVSWLWEELECHLERLSGTLEDAFDGYGLRQWLPPTLTQPQRS